MHMLEAWTLLTRVPPTFYYHRRIALSYSIVAIALKNVDTVSTIGLQLHARSRSTYILVATDTTLRCTLRAMYYSY